MSKELKPNRNTDLVLQEIRRIRVGDIFSLSANWGEGWGEVIPRSADEIRAARVNRVRAATALLRAGEKVVEDRMRCGRISGP